MDARTTKRFPLPSEVTGVPGAEGWRDLYPFFTRFWPEDDGRFWCYNSMHFPEPMPAFEASPLAIRDLAALAGIYGTAAGDTTRPE